MNRNFERSLAEVLEHEGGWSDHPSDPGGATNKGIALATYRRYINRNGRKVDLRGITDEQVARVYRKHYWDKIRGDDLPDGIDYATFDFAVNSGPVRAAKYLQRVLGVAQDGAIGPVTIAAAKRDSPYRNVINELCDDRMAFLKRLSTWGTFGRGWTRRVEGVRSVAIEMAGKRVEPSTEPRPEAPQDVKSGGLLALLVHLIARLFGKEKK